MPYFSREKSSGDFRQLSAALVQRPLRSIILYRDPGQSNDFSPPGDFRLKEGIGLF